MFNPAQEMSSIAFDKIIGGALNAVVEAQNNSSLTTVNFIKSVGFETDNKGNTLKPMYVDFKYPKEVAPYKPATDAVYGITVESGGENYEAETLNAAVYGNNNVKLDFTVEDGAIKSVNVVSGGENLKPDTAIKLPSGEDAKGSGAKLKVVELAPAKKAEAAVYQNMTLQVPLLTIVPIPFIRVQSTDIELNVKINSLTKSSDDNTTTTNAGMTANASYRGIFARGSVNINASVSNQKKSSSSEEVKKEYSLNIKIHAVQDEIPVGMSRILDILEESIVPKPVASVAA